MTKAIAHDAKGLLVFGTSFMARPPCFTFDAELHRENLNSATKPVDSAKLLHPPQRNYRLKNVDCESVCGSEL
jgi:hypothetical protein